MKKTQKTNAQNKLAMKWIFGTFTSKDQFYVYKKGGLKICLPAIREA